MIASRHQVYFIAIRMQAGNVRRDLGLVGLGERGRRVVLEAMDCVEAQVREWSVDGMVTEEQLREFLGALLKVPARLRGVVEAGEEERLSPATFEEWGVLLPRVSSGGGPPN